MFTISDRFKEKYPEAHAGILIMKGAENPSTHPALEEKKRQIESDLRAEFSEKEPQTLAALPSIAAYSTYYKHFDKTYHVLGQLNSVVFKEKPIPSVAVLVEAMFMAELKNGLLTAGHDLDQVILPITLNAAADKETFVTMRGSEQRLKSYDMYIADQQSILSSVIYGPDQRTQITPATHNVLFTVYAPKGIDPGWVENHLNDIREYVLMVSPHASVELLKVFPSS